MGILEYYRYSKLGILEYLWQLYLGILEFLLNFAPKTYLYYVRKSWHILMKLIGKNGLIIK